MRVFFKQDDGIAADEGHAPGLKGQILLHVRRIKASAGRCNIHRYQAPGETLKTVTPRKRNIGETHRTTKQVTTDKSLTAGSSAHLLQSLQLQRTH